MFRLMYLKFTGGFFKMPEYIEVTKQSLQMPIILGYIIFLQQLIQIFFFVFLFVTVYAL